MPIKQITTANTFGEWVVATQATVDQWNTLEPSINLVYQYANSTINVYTDTVSVYSNTVNTYNSAANVYANTVTLHDNVVANHVNVSAKYQDTLNVYTNTVSVYSNTYNISNTVFAYVQTAYDTANTVQSIASDAYNTANASNTTANTALANANIAFNHANAAFTHGNSAYNQINVVYNFTNTTFDFANTAFNYANGSFTTAILSFIYANNASEKANTAHLHANSAFDTVNVLLSYANTANLGFITDTSVDAEKFIIFVSSNTGNLTNVHTASTKLKYNPGTDVLTTNVNAHILMLDSTIIVDNNRNMSNVKAVKETVFTIVDSATVDLDPANGTIQLWTLGANRTPYANSFQNGHSLSLMIDDGASNTITWSTMNVSWVGNTAPSLATTGYTVIELWKANNKIYGARVGDVAQ